MPIGRVIDLSMPLDDGTPFYPGDPEPRVCAATTIAADGFNVARLELGSHCDAPSGGPQRRGAPQPGRRRRVRARARGARSTIDVGGTPYRLAAGDSLTFDAGTPHTWGDPSRSRPARVLWVLAPALE